MAVAGGRRILHRVRLDRARPGNGRLAVRLRSTRRGLPVDPACDAAARRIASGPPGDEPVLPIALPSSGKRMLALCLAAAAIFIPVRASAGVDDVHAATVRLDLAFSSRGANPTHWRACHASCMRTDEGTGTSVRFTEAGDPPLARLLLRGGDSTVNLDDLAFTAEIGEDGRTVTFRADLPVDGVRIEKSFELSPEGYDVAMAVRFSGPNVASFLVGRQLQLEIATGRGFHPAPAAGFAAMLERVSRVVVSGTGTRTVDDGRDPIRLGAHDWAGFRSRFWAIVVAADGGAIIDSGSATRMVIRLNGPTTERHEWRCTFYSGPIERAALSRTAP